MAMVDDWDPDGNASIMEEEPEAPSAPSDEPLYAGKYRSVDDMERGYEELNAAYGRQGNRVGELEKRLEQMEERLTEAEPEVDPYADEFWNLMPRQEYVDLLAKNPAGVIGEMARRIARTEIEAALGEVRGELDAQGETLETQQLVTVVADWMAGHDDITEAQRERMQDVFQSNQGWFYDDLASAEPERVHNAMSAIATLAGVGRSGTGSAAGATRVPRTAPSTRRPATGGNRDRSVGDQILDAMAAYGESSRLGIRSSG